MLGVLFFHGGFTWMVGGYLGVSTFFTLSGFLITSLLLTERASRGKVDLRAFWIRRFRRLMPASLACLGLVVVFGLLAADPLQRADLAGDAIAALAYVANWRFIFSDQSYADLFAEPSPVLHFWSLAIEEQFYVLYPLLIGAIVGVGALAPRVRQARRRRLVRDLGRHYVLLVAGALVVLLLASLTATLFGGFDENRIYLGTDTRAAELLIGGLLATILFRGHLTRRMAEPGPVRTAFATLGVGAAAASIALWVTAEHGTDWLYEGGFALYAGLSALVICAAVLPTGPVAWVLSLEPMRHLGQISYGVYLYHWPIFLWLRQKTDLEQWPRFLLGVLLTITVAEISYRFLEMPIRRGQRLFNVKAFRLAPVGIVAIAAAVIALSATAPPPVTDFAGAQEGLSSLADDEVPPPAPLDPTQIEPGKPRVAIFGDSTALMTGWGLAIHLRNSGLGYNVEGATGLGCAIVRAPLRRVAGEVSEPNDGCRNWAVKWKEMVDSQRPDLAIVQSGNWDVADVQLEGSDQWIGPGDPTFDQYLLAEMTEAVDVLSSNGGIVVWLTSPLPGLWQPAKPNWNPRERMEHYNQIVKQLPSVRPGKVVVVDLDEWIQTLPPGEDYRLRPDGIHFVQDTSVEVSEKYLFDAVYDAWREQWIANRTAELEGGVTVNVGVFGDGTAQRIGAGLIDVAGANNIAVSSSALDACGVTRGGSRRTPIGEEPLPPNCQWEELIYLSLVDRPTDVAVVHTGVWDVTDRQLAGDPTWRAPGDPFYDAYLRGEIGAYTDALHANGAEQVVWLLTPHIDWGGEVDTPADAASRVDRLNELIIESASSRNYVTIIDYAAFARSWNGGELDEAHRPDGVAPSPEAAVNIAKWLAPQLVQIARGATPQGALRPGG